MTDQPQWLDWAKELRSIAQAGLAYSKDGHDLERFAQVQRIVTEILESKTGVDAATIQGLLAAEQGYPTPKVDVRAAVFRDGRILMVKEKHDGQWALPGGWGDTDVSPGEMVVKEVYEEAGLRVRPRRLIAVLDRNRHNPPPFLFGVYKIFLEAEFLDGEFTANTETSDSGFFALDDLPPLSETRNTRDQIALCFEAHGKDYWEARFD